MAQKDYHQQETPVPRQSLDSHPGTLPSEKVMTEARIGIGYSDKEWHPVVRRCRQALHQDPEFSVKALAQSRPAQRGLGGSTTLGIMIINVPTADPPTSQRARSQGDSSLAEPTATIEARSQLAISDASIASPMIISGEVDLFPLQREKTRK
jgi:hypothetical protein